ncbi:Schlafen family member 13 [Platysternon megacephalum]|uniref:Schlafen family member 13 n=1 Tax=Platysternon megacephalum TaxID=55544 RepID=A0A4D9ES45_9SAUR|nr:Schlafen family member 13 [Platysternon megacephalum]
MELRLEPLRESGGHVSAAMGPGERPRRRARDTGRGPAGKTNGPVGRDIQELPAPRQQGGKIASSTPMAWPMQMLNRVRRPPPPPTHSCKGPRSHWGKQRRVREAEGLRPGQTPFCV